MIERVLSAIGRRSARPAEPRQPLGVSGPALAATEVAPEPMVRRVLSVIHDPVLNRRTGQKLTQALEWYEPDWLAAEYVRDVRDASHGLLQYQIVDRIEKDGFPRKLDGFCYDAPTFLRCWHARRGFHEPDAVDYQAILREFDVVERVNAGEIDELWLFAFPYSGYYESLMVGPAAFWCNSPPLDLRE